MMQNSSKGNHVSKSIITNLLCSSLNLEHFSAGHTSPLTNMNTGEREGQGAQSTEDALMNH